LGAKIVVADDHGIIRDLIRDCLNEIEGAEVSTAANLEAALQLIEEKGPADLVLLDYGMDGMNGLHGLSQMQKANSGKPVALFSGVASPEIAQKVIEGGFAGFVPKSISTDALVSAVRLMMAGEIYVPFSFMKTRSDSTLTRKELTVLGHVCDGKANKEIASILGLQEVTIKMHVKSVCKKLEARNRTHAAMIARDRNLC
jgi:DNA-binding NarL/FixJ family response regulator